MSTVDVEQALAAPIEARGKALLQLVEDQWFDRKSSRITGVGLVKTAVAMANADGGTIVVGLSNGKVEGVKGHPKKINEWQQAPLDFTQPPVPARARLCDCVNERGEADQLFVLEVETSSRVHTNQKDEVLLRVGDEDRILSFSQRQELLYEKGQASYEASPVSAASVDDLNYGLVQDYADAVKAQDPMRLLVARGLFVDQNPTVAGALLFGRAPQRFFPEASVRIIRYRGTERGAGSRQQIVHDARFEGAIPYLLDAARTETFAWIPTRQALRDDGRFGPVPLIPEDAWLEGIVNAVVHRSYSVAGDHIRVEIFDDRVEIESPGRFPGVADLRDPLQITRYARNPRIARVCADLRFGQELGEGIRRIFEEMRLAGLTDPAYEQTAGSVRLVLSAMAVDRELEARLPQGARELLRLIRQLNHPSTGDLVEAAQRSRPVVLKRLRALEEAGIVEWVGKNAKDPRAYWRLAQ